LPSLLSSRRSAGRRPSGFDRAQQILARKVTDRDNFDLLDIVQACQSLTHFVGRSWVLRRGVRRADESTWDVGRNFAGLDREPERLGIFLSQLGCPRARLRRCLRPAEQFGLKLDELQSILRRPKGE
jgi:hypothetical protein